MDTLIDADWRWLPCLAMLLVAGALWVRAAIHWSTLSRAGHRNLQHMVAFRQAMLGVGLAGIGAGWWLQSPVPFWAGVIVGLEETIESSIALVGLRMEAAEGRG